jgi:hypothetical protein
MLLRAVELWVRRAMAVLVAALSLIIFVPVGGFFYVFLLARATISLTLASFIAAMTGTEINANVHKLLEQSVSFFPTGFTVIVKVSSAMWRGDDFGNSRKRYDAASILTNVLLAIIFFAVLMTLFRALGWSGFGMPAILAWLFSTPILLVIGVALVAIFAVALWPMLLNSWRQFWRSRPPEKKQQA